MKRASPAISDMVDRAFATTRQAAKRKARPAEKYMAVGMLLALIFRLIDDEKRRDAR